MNIYILYHIKERELVICEMVKEAILEKNVNANVRVLNFDHVWQEVWDFKPDVILTIPPRVQWASNRLMMVKAALKCSIVSLVTEGFFYRKSKEEWRIYIGTNSYSEKLVDYYLFWGNKTKEGQLDILLEDKKITSVERAKVVGYVFYDKDNFRRYEKKIKVPNIVETWIKKYKKHILCLTGFQIADYTIDNFITESAFFYRGDKSKQDKYRLEVGDAEKKIWAFGEYRKKYITAIIQSAIENMDVGFLVKLHPAEHEKIFNGTQYQFYHVLDKYPNILLLDEAVPMGLLLPYSDLVIHYGSTAGLEAYLYKIPMLHLFMEGFRQQMGMPGYCIYESSQEVELNNFEEFNRCIMQGVGWKKLEEVEKILEEQFNWRENNVGYHPAEAIAEYVLESWNIKQDLDKDEELKKAARSLEGYRSRKDIWKKKVKVLWKQKKYVERDQYLKMLREITPEWKLILYDFLTAIKLTFRRD